MEGRITLEKLQSFLAQSVCQVQHIMSNLDIQNPIKNLTQYNKHLDYQCRLILYNYRIWHKVCVQLGESGALACMLRTAFVRTSDLRSTFLTTLYTI